MKKILWQTRSEILFDSVQQGVLSKKANGGNSYDFQAIQALNAAHAVSMDPRTVRRSSDNVYGYAFRLLRNQGKADLVVKEASIIALSPIRVAPFEIGMIHHLDHELMEKSKKHRWFFSRLLKRLPRLDLVITVSSYWKEKLQEIGCKNVEVIYNSFELSDFEISDEEVQAFLEREQIPTDKPILYIGGVGARKGAPEVYEALKDEDYYMVVTGAKKEIDLPVRWLNLERRDYLCLLKACSAVLTMSIMPEGWNRVAHEAMLCGTPVIGSGIGGMEELLSGGQQQIVRDFSKLRSAVKNTLENQEAYSKAGLSYASCFDMDYFKSDWLRVLDTCLSSSHQRAVSLV